MFRNFLRTLYRYTQYMCVEYVHKKYIYFHTFHFQIFPAFLKWKMKWKFLLWEKIFMFERIFPNFPITSHEYIQILLCIYLFFIHTDILLSWGLKSKNERKSSISAHFSLCLEFDSIICSLLPSVKKVLILTKKFLSSSHKK